MWQIFEGDPEEFNDSTNPRQKLEDYYGTAMQEYPMAFMDLADIDSMSDEEIARKAKELGLI